MPRLGSPQEGASHLAVVRHVIQTNAAHPQRGLLRAAAQEPASYEACLCLCCPLPLSGNSTKPSDDWLLVAASLSGRKARFRGLSGYLCLPTLAIPTPSPYFSPQKGVSSAGHDSGGICATLGGWPTLAARSPAATSACLTWAVGCAALL